MRTHYDVDGHITADTYRKVTVFGMGCEGILAVSDAHKHLFNELITFG